MSCPQCAVNPRSHSFIKIGQKADTGYWYTAAGKAEELVNTPEKFGFFRLHMNQAKQDANWIWIFDCEGMTSRHTSSIGFMKRLVGSLSNEHTNLLKEIWIIHPNMYMRAAVMLLSPFINKHLVSKIKFIDSTTDIEFVYYLTGVRLLSTPWKSHV